MSILHSSVEIIIKKTLSFVFALGSHSKSTQQAAVNLTTGIFATGSTLLHSIARFLNPKISNTELKQKRLFIQRYGELITEKS